LFGPPKQSYVTPTSTFRSGEDSTASDANGSLLVKMGSSESMTTKVVDEIMLHHRRPRRRVDLVRVRRMACTYSLTGLMWRFLPASIRYQSIRIRATSRLKKQASAMLVRNQMTARIRLGRTQISLFDALANPNFPDGDRKSVRRVDAEPKISLTLF